MSKTSLMPSSVAMKGRHLVVLTGAGISAESGLKTFRAEDGLWENHRVQDVATPEAWARDPKTVLRFYNERRRQAHQAQPNAAHRALAALESTFQVSIVTQNVDDLHERAGSTRVIHLHGELDKARSTGAPERVYQLNGQDLQWGDQCSEGHQLRPDIVWFGESVPMYDVAESVVKDADFLLVVGTSLQVQPASWLVEVPPASVPRLWVDPADITPSAGILHLQESATQGVTYLADYWLMRDQLVMPPLGLHATAHHDELWR